MLNRVRVKTVAGRIARESPRGDYIPTDRYVSVKNTPYIQRLLTVHGDIILEPEEKGKVVKAPKPAEAD